MSALRTQSIHDADIRGKLTSEALSGMKTIKSYHWEEPIIAQIKKLRNLELSIQQLTVALKAALVCILSVIPSLVSVTSLAVYAGTGNAFTASKVFTALALFGQLRFPLIFYPTVMNTMMEAEASVRRLEQFFASRGFENYIVEETDPTVSLRVVNGVFSWSPPAEAAPLSHASTNSSSSSAAARGQSRDHVLILPDLVIKKGELVVIHGLVGTGE
jgi:ABC-type multidrug transport system fused ATPase/permease subunit